MLEELLTFTDPSKIHELDHETAQMMYDAALDFVSSSIDSDILAETEIEENLSEATEILFAAEDFAYAYFKQNGSKLAGAPDAPRSLEHILTPTTTQVIPLTAVELEQLLIDYYRLRFPATMPGENRHLR